MAGPSSCFAGGGSTMHLDSSSRRFFERSLLDDTVAGPLADEEPVPRLSPRLRCEGSSPPGHAPASARAVVGFTEGAQREGAQRRTCLAESDDGIDWAAARRRGG